MFPNVNDMGDDVVGLMSQVGMPEDSPFKKVQYNEIFIDIDTYGGNGPLSLFHNKMPHRQVVMNKVLNYLDE